MSRRAEGRVDRFRNKWRARLRGEHIGVFDTKPKAVAALAAAKARAEHKEPNTCRTRVQAWFEARDESGIVALIEPQKSDWRARVDIKSAKWLDMEPRNVRTVHLQRWLKSLSDQEAMHTIVRKVDGEQVVELKGAGRQLSHESISKAASLVKLFFRWLRSEGCVDAEPAEKLIMPVRKAKLRKGAQRIIHLTPEEFAGLFELDVPEWIRAVYTLAVYAGLRRAEIWGLRWEFVDFKSRSLIIRNSYDGDCKSDSSVREVPMLPAAYNALQAYRATLSPRPLTGVVFPKDGGGCHGRDYDCGWRHKSERRGPGGSLREVPGWRAKAGVRREVTFQCLRHTTGVYLLSGTMLGNARPLTLKQVSEWLGHSSIKVTERHYSYLLPGNIHEAAHGRKVVQQSGT